MAKQFNNIKILFVCLGNICRSPLAEYILRDMVAKRGDSAGFYIASAYHQYGGDWQSGLSACQAEITGARNFL